KRSVESRTDHVLETGDRCLRIVIQKGEGALSKSPLTEQASPGSSIPSSASPPQQEPQAARGHGDKAREGITDKIFLTVSATLNTSMFTERDREKITIICPNLKRERNPGVHGSEKLTGDFTDIEKAYHYFKDILEDSGPNPHLSHSESKTGLKDENDLNTEEMNELTVPSALYEYFSHACKEQIQVLHQRFGVRIRSEDHSSGNTSICFTADKSPASIQEANDFFIRVFQKSVENLKQEKIPLAKSYTLNETIMKLNTRFSNLLAKEEEKQLLLRGPATEILAAKKFLAEEGEKSQAEKNVKISSELYKYRNGIAVDASVFKLLETILSKEIEDIKDKFDTIIEKKDSSCGQNMLIIFRPRIETPDMSSHATESFISAFQSAFAMLRETLISSKLSEDQKKRLNMLLSGKQLEDLHVKLKKKKDKFILSGLPNHLSAAEKHIMNLLSIEDSAQTKTKMPLSSVHRYQEATGAFEKKYNNRQKHNLSSEGQSKAKTEEENKYMCPICMETINDKKILRKCNHAFCRSCINQAMSYKNACPLCNTVYGLLEGDQPEGTMSTRVEHSALPGYPNCGTIVITYTIYSGIQTRNHPNPGRPYAGTTRRAYLPDNREGQEILQLLRKAFDQKLIFTVGQSHTTGVQDVITWNDIHHKTATTGGPTNFGYPDPDYLQRVRTELKTKGIE
ncbi:PREDICTED: E3 ubiquitin-protein ligase DTX3L, partial [Merops nubicus]|uniref:E3 ubiquitin-protein ligase DTX3L n=1 Tax=Merops nubicus TaxID=57421 RepID=UPI0004F0BB75